MNLESPTPERGPEILTMLREKLARLARWGIMASALTGILPSELAAQEPMPPLSTMQERIEKLEVANLRVRVRERIGEAVFNVLETPPQWTNDRAEGAEVPMKGFEKRPKVTKEMRKVISDAPDSFMQQVAEIAYDSRLYAMPGVYGMKENKIVAQADRNNHRITFSAGSNALGPILLAEELAHEICHFADPSLNTRLSEPERVRIFSNVLSRMDAPDRFHSWYVEHIQNADPQILASVKAGEYWAETCGAYLSHDKLLPEADRAMVESLIRITDPGYTRTP